MATWSEENREKLRSIAQLRGQASQNRFQGGQLLSQGINQLQSGISSGIDAMQAKRAREAQERQATAERESREGMFGKQLAFDTDMADKKLAFDTDAATGQHAKSRQQTLNAPGEWPKYIEEIHGPDRGNTPDKDKEDFDNLEAYFMNQTGDWAMEGTIKGKDGQSIPYTEDGRIQDWKNIDFKELETRLKTVIDYRTGWSKGQKTTAAEYAQKWIKYRMRDALESAITESKQEPGSLWESVKVAADAYSSTMPGPMSAAYKQLQWITDPPKNKDELISKIMGAFPGASWVDFVLRTMQGKTPEYSKLLPKKNNGFTGYGTQPSGPTGPISTPSPMPPPIPSPTATPGNNKFTGYGGRW